jgi:hypothetical protein
MISNRKHHLHTLLHSKKFQLESINCTITKNHQSGRDNETSNIG